MPKCLNDSSKTYTGNEPSPKGLGYCGHAESVGTKKKGKDGNIWIIIITTTGTKKWKKYKNNDYIFVRLSIPTIPEMKKIFAIIKKEKYKLTLVESPQYNNYASMYIKDVSVHKKILQLFKQISIKYPNFRYLVELIIENIKYPYRVHTNKKGKVIVTKAAKKHIGIQQY
jgi:hypothetical protein